MSEITTVGIDLAKSVFQVHGVDEHGKVVVRRQVRRSQLVSVVAQLPPCLIGMEAGAGAHHWSRQFVTFGHQGAQRPWIAAVLQRRGKARAYVAQANKTARIAWAVMRKGENFRAAA